MSRRFNNFSELLSVLLYTIFSLPFLTLQSFTDEYEHVMSGWFLLHGLLPYKDFFSHHAPLPLFLGVIAYAVPADPFLILRLGVLLMQISVWSGLLFLTKKTFHPVLYGLMALTALSIPTFLLQAALTDTIVSFWLLFYSVLIFHFWLYHTPKPNLLLWVYGFISVICFWSTIASILPLLVLGVLTIFVLQNARETPPLKNGIWPLALTLMIGSFFPIFFFFNSTFRVFWWSVFTYNSRYYYPFRLAQTETELRFGPLFQIGNQFWLLINQSSVVFVQESVRFLQAVIGGRVLLMSLQWPQTWAYYQLITTVYLHALQPVPIALGLAFLLCLGSLVGLKKIKVSGVFACVCLSFFFRSNEIFHLSPVFFGVAGMSSWIAIQSYHSQKWLLGTTSVLAICLLAQSLVPTYLSVLQNQPTYMPSSYTSLSQTVKTLSAPQDLIQVLDANMVYYPLTQRLPACRYHYYLPWLHQTPIIRQTMTECLETAQAKVLIIPDNQTAEVQALLPLINQHFEPSSQSNQVFVRKK